MHPRTKLLLQLIKERFFTRDNFWNLMFWFGITLSLFLSEFIMQFSLNTARFAVLISFSIVPYLLARLNKVTYTEDKIFLNSQGQPLTDRLPTGYRNIFGFAIVLTFFIYAPFFLSTKFMLTSIVTFFLVIITLYFLYKNCPISILFNKHAWAESVTGKKAPQNHYSSSSSSSNHHIYNNSTSSIRSPDYISDPQYRYLSSNIYN